MHTKLWQEIAAGKFRPLYLFYGAERYLLEETVAKLTAAIAPGGDSAFNLEKLDGQETTAAQVILAAGTASFFAENKLVIVKNAPWFSLNKKNPEGVEEKNKGDGAVLLEYLTHPVTSTCLVFILASEEKPNKTLKTVKTLLKTGEMVEFAPVQGEALQMWLKDAFRSRGQNLHGQAGFELVARSGNDLTFLAGEVEKISTYAGSHKTITLEDVQAIASVNIQTTIFNFIDAVAQSDVVKSRYCLEDILLKEGPYSIIPILAGHFRFMLLVQDMKSQGYGNSEIMKATGRSSAWFIDKVYRQAASLGSEGIKKVLQILLQADYKSKRGITGIEAALDLALLQICALTK